MADEKKPEEHHPTTSEALEQGTKTSLHEQVFGSDPDGGVNDTPRGAIGKNVVLLNPAAQPDGFGPMTSVGDTDRHH
jgi:hypothetical protein